VILLISATWGCHLWCSVRRQALCIIGRIRSYKCQSLKKLSKTWKTNTCKELCFSKWSLIAEAGPPSGSSWTAVSEPSADQLHHSCVQDFCLWEMARLWGCRTFFQDCQLKLSVRIAWEYCHSSHGTCPCDQFPWQGVQALVQIFIDSFFLPVDMEPRASCMPGICCTTVPDLTPVQLIF
jgi:hypothetical protein